MSMVLARCSRRAIDDPADVQPSTRSVTLLTPMWAIGSLRGWAFVWELEIDVAGAEHDEGERGIKSPFAYRASSLNTKVTVPDGSPAAAIRPP